MLYILNETVTLAASTIILLQLAKLEGAERLEHVPEIVFSDREVNVANVEAVKRYAVGQCSNALGSACLAVLLSFGELGDDGDAEQLLSCKPDCLLNGFLLPELHIADTGMRLAVIKSERRNT